MNSLAKKGIVEYFKDSLTNKIIQSEVPLAAQKSPCLLGIDEAGRGPVLGPMVYAIAYYPQADEEALADLKFNDSKALTEQNREKLFDAIQTKQGGYQNLGYVAKVLAPNMISNCMLRRSKYNLNALSHDTAIELIRLVESMGVKLSHVYIDTVGPPVPYKEKLRKHFPGKQFTVTDKADSKFPIVGAASICAKVIRDTIVHNWQYLESASLNLQVFDLGSGYPSDPTTKKFLERSIDPVFGFPTLARFSWSTVSKALDKSGSKCDWNEPDDNEVDAQELTKQQSFFKKFVQKKSQPKSDSHFAFPIIKKPSVMNTVRTNADKFFEDRLLSRNSIIWGAVCDVIDI